MRGLISAALMLPRRVIILIVKLYRRFVSPAKASPSCRFTPTCSAYALEAVTEWGVIAGLALSLWRLLRCNPFCRGGYDPVPVRKKRGAVGSAVDKDDLKQK